MHHGKKTVTLLWLLGVCLLPPECHGNQYDPHLFPATGPFCEGWYMRLVDSTQRVSIGFLFGQVLPASCSLVPMSSQGGPRNGKCSSFQHHTEQGREGERPLVVTGVLVQDSNSSHPLRAFQTAVPLHDYSVTVRGGPVVHNPDDRSPPDFAARFGENGSVVVRGDNTTVDVRVGPVSLWLQAVDPVPWGPGGEGPEGWLEHLPLPIHWFVYSLRSTVTAYKMTDTVSGRTVSGHGARLHMEKNWGQSFPPGWVWSQGVTDANVTWAVSGGIVDFDVLNVTAFLAGYRNPARNISFNFTPANSLVTFTHDGCQGVVNMTLTALNYRLVVKTMAPLATFSQCLLGPEKDGFRPVCVESYNAVVYLKAYRRHGFHFVLVDQVNIHQAALEFGGLYVCKHKCSGV
ncbi:uncharacterized protein LOC143288636 isoform X2 [Babylonia areolata]